MAAHTITRRRRLDDGRMTPPLSSGWFHVSSRGQIAGCRWKPGFTLIEVLVVVAIIALLLAVLIPSLARAREQARLTTCMANCKQIALSVASYQTEEKGYVPVMFNYAASVLNASNPPARACWVSVALRRYDRGTARLKQQYDGQFDPEAVWNMATKNAYEAKAMPQHFACPFEREKGAGYERVWDQDAFRVYDKRGRFESIQTFLWENIIRGQVPKHGRAWPDGTAGRGVPKYPAFTWNRVSTSQSNMASSFPDGELVPDIDGSLFVGTSAIAPSKRAYRRWTDGDVRRLRAGGFSGVTVAFCAQGEHILGDQPPGKIGWANPGSHRTSAGGGTNAIFADTHVEWVPGTQIGWP